MPIHDTRHLYKRPGAIERAGHAADLLLEAIGLMGRAESALNEAGYRGAEHGVHQAKLRVITWSAKVEGEIAVRKAFTRQETK